jgi:hypothetical protein
VGIEIIHDPVVALHSGELLDNVGQMRGEVLTCACLAQMPDDVSRGNDKRGDQGPHAMPNVLVFAFLRLPRSDGLRRVLPLQNLHTRLFIGADNHTTVLEEAPGLEI